LEGNGHADFDITSAEGGDGGGPEFGRQVVHGPSAKVLSSHVPGDCLRGNAKSRWLQETKLKKKERERERDSGIKLKERATSWRSTTADGRRTRAGKGLYGVQQDSSI
jgi:hypothetical protein